MPRPKTDPYYRELVNQLVADSRKSADIVVEVPRQAEAAGRKDIPGERTIRRLIADYKKMPDAEQAEYRPVVWPDTFEAGLLPWESARDVLDLAAYYFDKMNERLTVRLARWWYRARLASPGMPVSFFVFVFVLYHARTLASLRRIFDGSTKIPDMDFTGFLAFQPWRGKEAMNSYRRLSKAHPEHSLRAILQGCQDLSPERLPQIDDMLAQLGPDVTEQAEEVDDAQAR